ncbi:MAG: CHAT domain-containing protein [Deltaproteobacteria bacterium]|nr:CHAT domain-containing protein [Deltaproteobacteria bacterium]
MAQDPSLRASRGENPIHLTIHRRGDVNIVDLAEVGALIPRSEVQVSDGFLADLAGEMQRLGAAAQRAPVQEGASGNLYRDLERVGGLIFSHLLSEPARRRLRAATPRDLYLRLDERLVHVPWELCHDGDSFLSTKFRVGRQVITGQPIPETRDPVRESGRLRVLLVADPTESLPRAAAESEDLCALLDRIPGIETTLLAGSSVRRIPLLATLQDHDIVHFAGHSHYDADAPARSGWRLADGVLTAGELARLAYPPRLVFSNSCDAGASAQRDDTSETKTRQEETRAFGIGSAFLLAGVRNYVGTFWVVRDDESVEFALACYQALAAGETLGTALLGARRAVIGERHRGGLAWASYVLYGDPAYVPLRSHVPVDTRPGATPSYGTEPRPAASTRYRYSVEIATDQASHEARAVSVVRTASSRVVGREGELARLEDSLELALRGERQLVFVSGAAGIGKTSTVDELVRRVADRARSGSATDNRSSNTAPASRIFPSWKR